MSFIKAALIAVTLALAGCANPGNSHMSENERLARADMVRRGLDDNAQILRDMMPPKRSPEALPTPELKRIDATCTAKCTSAGFAYGLCESKCSY